jgi:hypothetical protein
MKSFKRFIDEDSGELDLPYISSAQRCSKFDINQRDFQSIKYKKEIQFLFNKFWFPDFDLEANTSDGVNLGKLNSAIEKLRKINSKGLIDLHKYTWSGVGPGEALLYFLVNDGYLGGGASAGVDLIAGGKEYEIKAVTITKDGYASNFKTGATFSVSSEITKLQSLKSKLDLGGKKSEVNDGDLKTIRKEFPDELSDIEKSYIDKVYKNYFSKHKIIFMDNKKVGKVGSIHSIKSVKKTDISLERVTSGVIKPKIKL